MAFKTSSSNENRPVAEINITPLVDVMLVLLVIFMVTAPLMDNGIPIQLPKTSAKALPKDEAPVVLSLSKDSRVSFNQQEIPYSEIRKRVESYFKTHSKKEIFIKADAELPYGVVAHAMAEVKNGGVDKIGLLTQPKEKEK